MTTRPPRPVCESIRHGFTLVELLVVVGIIAVLMGMLLPAAAGARRNARTIHCQSNIRQLAMGLLAYASTYRNRFPPNVTAPPPGQFWSDDARIGVFVPLPVGSGVPSSSVFVCPEDELARRSYAMNIWASSKIDSAYITTPPTGQLWAADTRNSCELLLLVESWSYTGSATSGYSAVPAIGGVGEAGSRFGAAGGIAMGPAGRWGTVNSEVTYARHRRNNGRGVRTQPIGRTTVAFADGHVELLSNYTIVDYETGRLSGRCVWSLQDLP